MGDVNLDDGAIEAMFNDPDGPVAKILEKKIIEVETLAKILVNVPGSGRLYTTKFFRGRGGHRLGGGHSGVFGPAGSGWQVPGKLYAYGSRPPHRASAPGEPPASDTGTLLGLIGHSVSSEGGHLVARVTSGANYTLYLELGTRYMKPRPFLRPALDAAK